MTTIQEVIDAVDAAKSAQDRADGLLPSPEATNRARAIEGCVDRLTEKQGRIGADKYRTELVAALRRMAKVALGQSSQAAGKAAEAEGAWREAGNAWSSVADLVEQ